MSSSITFQAINSILKSSQQKLGFLWENSFFLQNIDKLILASILMVFIASTFASSDTIGYIALITLFLTIIKIFVKNGEEIKPNLFETALLFYFLIVLISVFASSLYLLSLKGFLKTLTYLGFYFSCVQYFKHNLNKIWLALGVIAAGVGIESILGVFQNFSQVGEISTWQDISGINPEDVMTRVYGTLKPLNPNLFGGYLIAGIPAILGLLSYRLINSKFKTALCAALFLAISTVVLFLTGCRGAYIGFFAIVLMLFIVGSKIILAKNSKSLTKLYYTIIGSITCFAAFLMLSISQIRTRIFSIFAMRADSSTSFRMNVYQSSIEMLKDNWLFGIGVGNQNFREIYGLYMKTGFDALSAYSVYLEIAVESGIFALMAFLIFLGLLFYSGFKFAFTTNQIQQKILVLTALISITGVMAHGLVDTVFFRPQIQFIFWFMVAIVSTNLNKPTE